MSYLTIITNPPPLDTKIIVKKEQWIFDDCAKIVTLSKDDADIEFHVDMLDSDGFKLWRLV